MNTLTILVVDDDPVIRRLLEQRLKKENHTVFLAEDGYEAEKIIESSSSIDVILTDLMMPGEIGGIEVLEIAKNKSRLIEVILITAHSSVNTAVEAMKKGASDYLEKPINFTELFLRLQKISNMLSLLRSAEDLRQAMDVTEATAGKTIQNLEIAAGSMQEKLDAIESILTDDHSDAYGRIAAALEVIYK